jgi:acetyl-CoA carboxylase carboxyl transferase subunit beta
VEITLDPGSWREIHAGLMSIDPLGFAGARSYAERLKEHQKKTGLDEAALTGYGAIRGEACVFGVTDCNFMMGSMGSVVGERLTRAIETATAERLPLIIVSGSGGGARMDEGALSLMQMAKTSASLARHAQAKQHCVSDLTDPTYGGVSASFAMLGDVILAEPKARAGFTGPRVIEQTMKVKLPAGFQESEFLRRHGQVDMVVGRGELPETLARIIRYCRPRGTGAASAAAAPAAVAGPG